MPVSVVPATYSTKMGKRRWCPRYSRVQSRTSDSTMLRLPSAYCPTDIDVMLPQNPLPRTPGGRSLGFLAARSYGQDDGGGIVSSND